MRHNWYAASGNSGIGANPNTRVLVASSQQPAPTGVRLADGLSSTSEIPFTRGFSTTSLSIPEGGRKSGITHIETVRLSGLERTDA